MMHPEQLAKDMQDILGPVFQSSIKHLQTEALYIRFKQELPFPQAYNIKIDIKCIREERKGVWCSG